MKTLKWIMMLIVPIMTASCEKEELETNEVYRSKDLKIEFKDYTDTRCPLNADCIWEGESIIYLSATSKNETVSFSMDEIGSDTTVFGHRIEFVDLLPYPETNVNIDFKDKKAVLNVTKI